jgi:hypothetical protein
VMNMQYIALTPASHGTRLVPHLPGRRATGR